jgi:hypothetical protein
VGVKFCRTDRKGKDFTWEISGPGSIKMSAAGIFHNSTVSLIAITFRAIELF